MDPVSFFHLQLGRVHSSKVSSVASLADRIFGALTDEQMRVRPGTGLNSLVWLLWHMARVEDVAVAPMSAPPGSNLISPPGPSTHIALSSG